MRLTLFRGSDDGFTFIGVLILLLVVLLLVPAVSALAAARLEEDTRVLKERHELFLEQQAQLDAGTAASGSGTAEGVL